MEAEGKNRRCPQLNSRFPAALAISLLMHLLLFSSLFISGIFPARPALNELEVIYYRVKSKSVSMERNAPKEVSRGILDKVTSGQPIILSRENKIPGRSIPISDGSQKDPLLQQKSFAQKPILANSIEFLTKDSIALSPLEIEPADKLSQDPAYLKYGNYTRERIKRCLLNRVSGINDKGIVCLKFTICADGALDKYWIIGEKSNASDALKQIAIAGLKDAAPFPALPKELNSQTATFTVFIHFINKESD